MFDWMFGWWSFNEQHQQHHPLANHFNAQDYKQYAVDRRAQSDLVNRSVFKCHPFTFKFRYVIDDDNGRCCRVVDFCKGLEINHELMLNCKWDSKHVRHLNEIVFKTPPVEISPDSMGTVYATKHGLIQILQQLSFEYKDDVLLAIKTDKGYDCDDVRDNIKTVLKHIKTLNVNSDKFINAHKLFENQVCARFEQLEQRLETLERVPDAPTMPGVIFPRDVNKHQHLAVFVNQERGNTQIGFARGQEEYFRKRKLEFEEEDMHKMLETVHPNPQMAVQCIKDRFISNGYKIKKVSNRRRVIEVDCNINAAKDIVNNVIIS
ncbi:hypothetical protein [Epiphyas postvittana nucleopolyhedrovirus]|uniref:DUF3627 domain-containing protein n=1 Tax=Epiphyas postvittana nucleopolyhedrovirus TaxID=70600 RepID=Q91GN7_NPVEP|nr:hypothetical protein [Epiphyas postvittana nucleopolyhedrovirus]AAK85574.1 unknown [Epiphyas postvittana nucleopolyhedrovirus]